MPNHLVEHDLATWSRLVKERDFGRCTVCGGTEELMVKHLVPPERGGHNTLRNGVTMCVECYHKGPLPDQEREVRTTRLNLEVDRGVYLDFREVCKANGRTVSDVVRTLIGEFLQTRGGEPR